LWYRELVKTVHIRVPTTPKPSRGKGRAFYLYVPCHHAAAPSLSAITLVLYRHPAERKKERKFPAGEDIE
jgi:hypothetical protein